MLVFKNLSSEEYSRKISGISELRITPESYNFYYTMRSQSLELRKQVPELLIQTRVTSQKKCDTVVSRKIKTRRAKQERPGGGSNSSSSSREGKETLSSNKL